MTIKDEAGPQTPPAVGEFALQERAKLLSDNADLRARLAKYEDAEGNPISTIAEQAREIERLRLNIAEYNEHERCYQSELATLKAQPSGVVLPEPKKEIVAWGYDMGGNYDEGHADGWNDALDEVARLNSSPVSSAPNHSEQVRHMVLEGMTVERDVFGTIHIKSGDFDFIQIRYQYPYTDNAGTWKLAERIVALLAGPSAAPAHGECVAVPAACRQRLAAEGKAYPKSSCAVCGQFSPKWKECDAILAQHGKAVGDE